MTQAIRPSRPSPPPLTPTPPAGLDGALAFWLAVGATVLVHFAPLGELVGRPLVWFATMVHELGHGVTALLLGGDFVEFRLYADGSGVAPSAVSSELRHAVVSAGGLVGPSVAAAAGFALARSARWARVGLVAIALLLTWALIFKVRTWFGAGFVGAVVVTTGGLALLAPPRAAQLGLMFLSIQLALSLWSDLDYMFSATAATGAGNFPSDSANMASALGGTYWMWGGLCGLISLAALGFGALLVLRDRARRPQLRA